MSQQTGYGAGRSGRDDRRSDGRREHGRPGTSSGYSGHHYRGGGGRGGRSPWPGNAGAGHTGDIWSSHHQQHQHHQHQQHQGQRWERRDLQTRGGGFFSNRNVNSNNPVRYAQPTPFSVVNQPAPPAHPMDLVDDKKEEEEDTTGASALFKDETKERMALYQEIIDNIDHSVDDRIEAFARMEAEQQYIFFYPDGVTSETIPRLDPPSDWEERVKTAIDELQEDVKEAFITRKRPRENAVAKRAPTHAAAAAAAEKLHLGMEKWLKKNPKPKESDADYEVKIPRWEKDYRGWKKFYDGEDDSVESMSEEETMNDQDESQKYAPALHFLRTLQYCPPLTAPFLAHGMAYMAGQSTECYCPCGNAMARWRTFFRNDHFIESYNGNCETDTGRKNRKGSPAQVWKHILTKKDECKAHLVVYEFVNRVFQNFHAKGVQHIALEDLNTKQWKKAHRIISKKLEVQIDFLKKEAEKKKVLEAKLKIAQDEQQLLLETNCQLANKLEAEKKLKEQFQATNENALSKSGKKLAQLQYNEFPSLVEKSLEVPLLVRDSMENKKRKKSKKVKISLDQSFDLNVQFEKWYDSYFYSELMDSSESFAFLFAPLPCTGENICSNIEELQRVMQSWKIVLNNNIKGVEEAKDEGGPTRHFFNRIWLQLGDLSVPIPGTDRARIKLFGTTKGGLVPQKDEMIDYGLRKIGEVEISEKVKESTKNTVEAYFRAVGRMIAHCMLVSRDSDTPITIANHVLPHIYKNILLRGFDIGMPTYPLGNLIVHCNEIMDIDYTDIEQGTKTLYRSLGIEGIDDTDKEKKRALRTWVKETYDTDRSLALKGLRSGLDLGGAANWSNCFRFIPTETITQLAFGRQEITRDMLFNEDGRFRFIKFEQYKHDPEVSDREKEMQQRQNQELFQRGMEKLFDSKLESEPMFIINFLSLCTASDFIPDIDCNPNFKITVEFNLSETGKNDYPRIHTCETTMVLPVMAYEGNMEKFEKKLEVTMKNSQNIFDMA